MTTVSTAQLTPPVSERDHTVGPASAAITLVEYGDYECPHCGAAHPIVKEIRRRLGNGLRFAFKFWQMHDQLFEHQDALDDAYLLAYAAAIGLDVDKFAREMALGVHAPRVREDFLSGVRSGVNGTPTFFINGHRHDGSYEFQALLAAIASTTLLDAGYTTPELPYEIRH